MAGPASADRGPVCDCLVNCAECIVMLRHQIIRLRKAIDELRGQIF
jgi:hypothetical protein